MNTKLMKFLKSFHCALQGIPAAFNGQRNIKIQFFIGIIAIVLSVCLKVTKTEFIIIVFISFLVIILEMINTAIEDIVDIISNNEIHDRYGTIKDILAGAVLLASVLSVIIGFMIFLPHVIALLGR
jgi:diacylglycerol kinase